MDLLSRCTTTVQLINGFPEVHYRIYEISGQSRNVPTRDSRSSVQTGASQGSFPHEYEKLRTLRELECSLRLSGALVAANGQLQLWLFGRSQAEILEKVSSGISPSDIGAPNSFTDSSGLIYVRAGSATATDLLRDPTVAPKTEALARGPSSPVIDLTRENEVKDRPPYTRGSLSQQLLLESQLSSTRIYHLFIAACLQSIMVHLSKTSFAIPLNSRSMVLVSPSVKEQNVALEASTQNPVLGLDTTLTGKGELLVTINIGDPNLKPISKIKQDETVDASMTLVRIAPSGRLGCISPPLDFHESTSGSEIKVGDNNSTKSAWRASVEDFLRDRGINCHNLYEDHSWCRVRLVEIPQDLLTQQRRDLSVLDEQGAFDWPRSLCFQYHDASVLEFDADAVKTGDEDGLKWFGNSSEGYQDPLETALRLANQSDEVNASNKASSKPLSKPRSSLNVTNRLESIRSNKILKDIMDWEPPLPKPNPLHDVDKGAIMYPTPPEALSMQNMTSAQATRKGELLALQAHGFMDKQAETASETLGKAAADVEMDLGSSNVTEADFDFFNEPDTNIDGTSAAINNVNIHHEVGITTKPQSLLQNDTSVISSSPTILCEVASNIVEHSEVSIPSEVQQIRSLNSPADGRGRNIDNITPFRNRARDLSSTYSTASVSGMDQKYDSLGRFNYLKTNLKTIDGTVPRLTISLSDPKALMNNITSLRRLHVRKKSRSTKHAREPSESDTYSESGSDMDSEADVLSLEDVVTVDRKRRKLTNGTESIVQRTTPTVSSMDGTTNAMSKRKAFHRFILLHMICRSSIADWSLVDFPPPSAQRPRPFVLLPTLNLPDLVEVAQYLADQVASATTKWPEASVSGDAPILKMHRITLIESCVSVMSKVLQHALGSISEPVQQDASSNALVEGTMRQPSTSKFQPKPVPRRKPALEGAVSIKDVGTGATFQIQAPMLRLQKTDDASWDFSAPALAYWEVLGLAPSHGPKRVKACCVYPENEALREPVQRFLETMSNTWNNLRLGTHQQLEMSKIEHGLCPVHVKAPTTSRSAVAAYRDACIDLGKALGNATSLDDFLVVYVVNPFSKQTAVFELCACFYLLVKAYNESQARKSQDGLYGQLVLQLIPINLIASFDTPVFIDPTTAAGLAREVYTRCRGSNPSADLPISSGAAVELAEQSANDIDFQLVAKPPTDLMRENSCMHVAYCRSLDDNWITAAWTDNVGRYQHQASYVVKGAQAIRRITQEIWNSTLQYIGYRKVHWRLFVVSSGPMPLVERRIWYDLAVHTKKQISMPTFNLTLVSINTSPTTSIYPRQSLETLEVAANDSRSTTMDTATPLAASTATPSNLPFSPIATPPSATAVPTPLNTSDLNPLHAFATSLLYPTSPPATQATASFENDPEARLLDLADETCGIVLSRRLNVSRAVVDYHPALASGYLFKRTGVTDTDMPALLEVNIMAVDLMPAATSTNRDMPPNTSAPGRTAPRAPPPSFFPSMSQQQDAPSPQAAAADGGDKQAARQKRYDAALREVLVMYRNLALLARVRGIQNVKGTTPWHVVVAMRAAEGLRKSVGAL